MIWKSSQICQRLDARFCVEALAEALSRYGKPVIFNTDRGSQFISRDFTNVLKDAGVAISMDGRGRCMDKFLSSGYGGRSNTRRSTCSN